MKCHAIDESRISRALVAARIPGSLPRCRLEENVTRRWEREAFKREIVDNVQHRTPYLYEYYVFIN